MAKKIFLTIKKAHTQISQEKNSIRRGSITLGLAGQNRLWTFVEKICPSNCVILKENLRLQLLMKAKMITVKLPLKVR